ncbi:MAG: MMPL family transporter [Bacteroidota bacterium]|nr:MAG: MMPL family transporter [Bacteroidota bacterium]
MKSTVNNWFGNLGMNVLLKYKYMAFILYLVVLLVGIMGMKRLVMDNSYKSMLSKNDSISKNNEIFSELFGNSDYVFLMVEAQDIIDHDVLKYMQNLGKDIEQNLPFVKDYMGITKVEYVRVEGDELIVEDLIGNEIPSDLEAIKVLKEKVLSKEIYSNRLISGDGKEAGLFIRFNVIPDTAYVLKEIPEGQPKGVYFSHQIFSKNEIDDLSKYNTLKDARRLITPSLEYLMEKNKGEFKTTATGIPISNYYVMKTLQTETGRTFMITLVLAILLLAFLFRSFAGVTSPILVIISAIIITFGTIGWFGIVVSTFALVVALLILVSSIGYAIHLLNHFQAHYRKTGNRREALRYMYENSGWPCFIAAATTTIGLVSFVMVDMVPVRNMGITGAIGVFVTFVLTIFLIPAFLSFGKSKLANTRITERITEYHESNFMRWWAGYTVKNFKIIGIVTAAFILLCAFYVTRITADTNYINLFGEKNKFVRDAMHSTEKIGSLYSYEILIELPEEGMAKDPAVLKSFEDLDTLINSFRTTKIINSVNELLKDINKTMHDNDPEYYKVPESKELIAQYLLLYEMSGGEELANWVDFSYQNLRKSVRVKESTTDLIYGFDEIKEYVQGHFPAGTKVKIAGDMAIMLRAVASMVEGQILSILFAFIGISIMMIITLRSFVAGLLSMIPNVIPLFFIMGYMGFAGITLNIQSMVVAPLILGIAVDDTVHFFLHFKQEFEKTKSYKKANADTMAKIGWSLVHTSIIIMVGFLPYAFSIVTSLKQLAILTILGVFIALVADLLITPGLFVLLKPFGKPTEEDNNDELNKYEPIKKEMYA